MKQIERLKFYNPTKGNLSFNEVVEEVFSYLRQSPQKQYEVIVGCDSSSDASPAFPVALVVLKKGEGGRFFLAKIKYDDNQKFFTLHQRILQEVLISCDMALEFREALKLRFQQDGAESSRNYTFQYIHADVSENGRTSDMVKEVVGLIKSNGFEAKIKPESFAASVVADKFT